MLHGARVDETPSARGPIAIESRRGVRISKEHFFLGIIETCTGSQSLLLPVRVLKGIIIRILPGFEGAGKVFHGGNPPSILFQIRTNPPTSTIEGSAADPLPHQPPGNILTHLRAGCEYCGSRREVHGKRVVLQLREWERYSLLRRGVAG
jgi:hypothetical protein